MMRFLFAGTHSCEGRSRVSVGASLLAIRGHWQSIASKLVATVDVRAGGWASAYPFNDGLDCLDCLDWLRRVAARPMLNCCMARLVWRRV